MTCRSGHAHRRLKLPDLTDRRGDGVPAGIAPVHPEATGNRRYLDTASSVPTGETAGSEYVPSCTSTRRMRTAARPFSASVLLQATTLACASVYDCTLSRVSEEAARAASSALAMVDTAERLLDRDLEASDYAGLAASRE